jgi:hypothetical protein
VRGIVSCVPGPFVVVLLVGRQPQMSKAGLSLSLLLLLLSYSFNLNPGTVSNSISTLNNAQY